MKNIIKIILAFTISTNLFSQEESVGLISKFGLAVGFNPGWIFIDLDEINTKIDDFGVDKFDNGIFTTGGSGYFYIMLLNNFRIGWTGFSGSRSSEKRIADFDKKAIYEISSNGVTIEYSLPFIEKMGVSFGAIIGWGNQRIEFHQVNKDYSWNTLWSEVSDTSVKTNNISRIIDNDFWTITPTINIDVPINRFAALRLGGGYLITLANKWKIADERELKDVPSGLKANSFFIQAGLYVGFFAY
ncbi:MAG: hypothetical protein JW866_07255 [Ignavibacteriales bacterium]|nr:hypothetical protein [Ignavibacteriales bacterium]